MSIKKKTLITFCFILAAYYSVAQDHKAIVLGYNHLIIDQTKIRFGSVDLPYPYWEFKEELSTVPNIHLGYLINKKLIGDFHIEYELNYSTKSSKKIKSSTKDYSIDNQLYVDKHTAYYSNQRHHLDLCATVQKEVIKKMHFELGIALSYRINSSNKFIKGSKLTRNIPEQSYTISNDLKEHQMHQSIDNSIPKPFSLNGVFGIRKDIQNNFFIRARSYIEFNTYTAQNSIIEYDYRRVFVQFSIGKKL